MKIKMVFKLVRSDTEEPCKIQLPTGTHLIGRGKFLDCDDKRISRNHGELLVADDSITIKALHQNPCFYTKKGTDHVEVLKLNNAINLSHGDKFGLLPNSYWYEILHCTSVDINQSPIRDVNVRTVETHRDSQQTSTDVANETESNKFMNETVDEGALGSPSLIQNGMEAGGESPSLTPAPESPSLIASADIALVADPSTEDTQPTTTNNQNATSTSPSKRLHSPDQNEPVDTKKVKTEPEDGTVKQEPDVQPGPSDDQGDGQASSNKKTNLPPSPAKPPNPGRERCMYGANCYRKNPQHKAQFSHPADPDWGSGAQVPCPYGGGCRRRDPRHWRDHEHPAGMQRPSTPPPRQPGMRVVERNGNIFYINAHTVNFYDDHFQVEDSDGDSVDFDYEF